MNEFVLLVKKDGYAQVATAGFVILSVWWIVLCLSGIQSSSAHLVFGAVYGTTMSAFGAILGLQISRTWGGMRSYMGKAILFLSLGLLAQFFGQFVFSYYNIVLGVEIPYPSLADIGYFGNIPLYIYGVMMVAKSSGVVVSMRKFGAQIQAVVIPVVMIAITYVSFLQKYEFAGTPLLTIFLDFGYPVGQALYVSIALLIWSLTYKILGGVMRSSIVMILIALLAQFVADYNFLLQNIHETWVNGGYGDYLYLVAYYLMTLALIHMSMRNVKGRLNS